MITKSNEAEIKNYPHLLKLGIKIYKTPEAHVKCKDLEEKLTKHQFRTFNKFFGVQTGTFDENGNLAFFPWDVEAVLTRMFQNKLIGSQLLWD